MDGIVESWWEKLSQEEKGMVKEVMYRLDLKDYIEMDDDGNYLKVKEEFHGNS